MIRSLVRIGQIEEDTQYGYKKVLNYTPILGNGIY